MIPAETSESLETANNYLAETDEHPNQGQPPTCLLGIFSRRTSNQMRAKALFIVLILLALFLSLLGGPREGIRTSYATLYKHFWQRMWILDLVGFTRNVSFIECLNSQKSIVFKNFGLWVAGLQIFLLYRYLEAAFCWILVVRHDGFSIWCWCWCLVNVFFTPNLRVGADWWRSIYMVTLSIIV